MNMHVVGHCQAVMQNHPDTAGLSCKRFLTHQPYSSSVVYINMI